MFATQQGSVKEYQRLLSRSTDASQAEIAAEFFPHSAPPSRGMENGTGGDHRGGRLGLGAVGVDDRRDDEDISRLRATKHRNHGLRGDTAHLHGHGHRPEANG